MTPAARAFLDDLIALCQRHQVALTVDTMYGCVTIARLVPNEDPIDEGFWDDALEETP